MMRTCLLLLTLTLLARVPLPAQSAELTLTYLGNMGVLLRHGATTVVIDGLHRGALREYAAVPPVLLEPLEQARDPFRRLDLALTTHRHRDHFDAASVAARLAADARVTYVAPEETVALLRQQAAVSADDPRVRAVAPPPRGERQMSIGGLDVTVVDLPHNPTPTGAVQNVGFLVDLGGMRVLHVGDADPTAARFDVHALARRRIDVAVVPFWYLTGADHAVRRSVGARTWVASHVPPANADAVRQQVHASVPDAIVLTTPGERHALR